MPTIRRIGSSPAEEMKLPRRAMAARLEQSADKWVFGAFAHRRLVGVVTLIRETRRKERHKASIYSLYVDKKFQGLGLGRLLLDRVIQSARTLPKSRKSAWPWSRATKRPSLFAPTPASKSTAAKRTRSKCEGNFMPSSSSSCAYEIPRGTFGSPFPAASHTWDGTISFAQPFERVRIGIYSLLAGA